MPSPPLALVPGFGCGRNGEKKKAASHCGEAAKSSGSGGSVSRGGYSGCLTAQLPEPREHGFGNHVRRHFRECAIVVRGSEGRPLPKGGIEVLSVSAFAIDEIEAGCFAGCPVDQYKDGCRLVMARDIGEGIEELKGARIDLRETDQGEFGTEKRAQEIGERQREIVQHVLIGFAFAEGGK